MKRTFFILFSLVLLLAACGHSDNNGDEQTTGESLNQDTIARQLEGDSTIYGLACEGSNDSIIVILTSIENDPDTIDILEARINRRVFGRPEIGDQLAIMMNTQRKSVADIVINIDHLKGEWCYQVMPRLRRRVGAATDSAVQLPPDFPDSLRRKWFQPREYGFELRRDNTVRPIGLQRNEAERQPGPSVPILPISSSCDATRSNCVSQTTNKVITASLTDETEASARPFRHTSYQGVHS